jgi:hypothetical protein
LPRRLTQIALVITEEGIVNRQERYGEGGKGQAPAGARIELGGGRKI